MMVPNKYSSYLRYTILKTEAGVLSLMIKEIFAKVCALYNNHVNPENESLKGLLVEAFTPSQLEESQMDPPTEKPRWQSTLGNRGNGLIQECCDNIQPRQGSFNMDFMK